MRYAANGRYIKELRQRRERCATQKELAYEIGISERQLRNIENGNAALPVDVLEKISEAFGVPWQTLVFASGEPRLVPTEEAATPVLLSPARISEQTVVPRLDTTNASVAKDEADLFASAKGSHVVVSHVLTRMTSETEAYADEMLDVLESVTWEKRDPSIPIAGREELRMRGRLRDLLVLLKGNDVWVYLEHHFKYFPESDVVRPKRDFSKIEIQTIIAFGPPGEYGEDTIELPVDHGQPRVYDPNAKLF